MELPEVSLAARVRLKTRTFAQIIEAKWPGMSMNQRSQQLGVAHTTLSRIFAGSSRPGADFIAAVLLALKPISFDTLFEIVDDGDEKVA